MSISEACGLANLDAPEPALTSPTSKSDDRFSEVFRSFRLGVQIREGGNIHHDLHLRVWRL